jgi:lipopolysaccharide export system protein LptA
MALCVNAAAMNRYLLHLVALMVLCTVHGEAFAQQKKKVKYHHSDELIYDKSLVDAQRLIGNVHLEYEGTHFYCDSAYRYANDDFDAFSNIRIQHGTDYNVRGDNMHFDSQKRTATLTQNIVLRDRDMTLKTNYLIYQVDAEVATYTGGGTIVSNANQNQLNSERGSYHGKNSTFYFRKNVVLKNPDYTVHCDTMQYNNTTEITYFFGPTTITGKDTEIYCENGYYNTRSDESRFGKNARVISDKTTLTGDSIYYNGASGVGEVFRNVMIRDSSNTYFITGDYGRHTQQDSISFVTGHALMTQVFELDSLFLHADTLKSVPDSSGKNVLFAHHRVKWYKTDLQGKCDSLIYAQTDSSLHMFTRPVLWSDASQVTGDTIHLQMMNNQLHRLLVRGHAMIVSQTADSTKYNQIKGRNMTGYFEDNALNKVEVTGNGQLIYYPESEKSDPPRAMGLNRGDCASLVIHIKDNQVVKITMVKDAASVFHPVSFITSEMELFDGFQWRQAERPMRKEEVFQKDAP